MNLGIEFPQIPNKEKSNSLSRENSIVTSLVSDFMERERSPILTLIHLKKAFYLLTK
jgi:hypothetical protein